VGDVYRLDWCSKDTQEFLGGLAMDFHDEQHWEYRIEIVAAEPERHLLDVKLLRHWGAHEDSITGRQEFDSARRRQRKKTGAWRVSEDVGRVLRLELTKRGNVLSLIDPEASRDHGTLSNLERALQSGNTLVVEEELIDGAVVLECVPTARESASPRGVQTCSTGAVRQKPSEFETRQFIADQIQRLAGPGKLVSATVNGTMTGMHEQVWTSTTKVEIVLVVEFGESTDPSVAWRNRSLQTGTLRRE